MLNAHVKLVLNNGEAQANPRQGLKETKQDMVSDKYIAGFIDSDGSIGLSFIDKGRRPLLRITWTQKTCQDEVLSEIHKVIGGKLDGVVVKGNRYSRLHICGRKAEALLNRIRKHLVIKRRYADVCMKIAMERVDDPVAIKEQLKRERKIASLPIPNFPTRKWLAGYIDGDGCFSVTQLTPRGTACPVLHIAASNYDTEGIEVIQKAFGGRIHDMNHGRVKQYVLPVQPSKAIKLISYCGKHMIVKRDQAQFILNCAKMGHYRDGKSIKLALKQLKAQPHRLNEPRVDLSIIMAGIKDVPPYWNKKGAQACIECGTRIRKHTAFGLCGACYQRSYRRDTTQVIVENTI